MDDNNDDKTRIQGESGGTERRPVSANPGESESASSSPGKNAEIDDKTRVSAQDNRPTPSPDKNATRIPARGATSEASTPAGDDATRVAKRGATPEATAPAGDDATRAVARSGPPAGGIPPGDDASGTLPAAKAPATPPRADRTRLREPAPAPIDDSTRVQGAVPDGRAADARTVVSAGGTAAELPPQAKAGATRVLSDGAEQDAPAPVEITTPSMVDTSAERGAGKQLVKDRFVLEKQLGAGGMGSVFMAKDLRKVEAQDRNPWVAIKLLNEDFRSHPASFMSLQREARKSQTLAHPNIVTVYDFDRDGDMVFMTMELLQGNDLNHFIKDNPHGIELDEVKRLTREMGAALEHAHSHNITHADFKPANVFMTEDGTAKVLDFGIAQAVANVDADAATDDKTAFDPGSLGALTPAYASLEMLEGQDPVPADDVYALGCIAYQLLTGKHPYGKMPADEAARKDKRAERIEGLSRREWRVLQKAVAFKREERCETVEEFLSEFAPIANPWVRRLGIAVGIALVLGGIGVYQAVTNYAEAEAVREREAAVAARQQRMEAQQAVKNELDARFSALRTAVREQEKQLDNHLDAFSATETSWFVRMGQLETDFRRAHEEQDWRGVLDGRSGLEDGARETLLEKEIARRAQEKQATDNWIQRYRGRVADAYLGSASELASEKRFADARESINTAASLSPDSPKLAEVREEVANREETYRLENDRLRAAVRESELTGRIQRTQTAIQTDLNSCTQTLSRTGRGGEFTYDIAGLARQTRTLEGLYKQLGRPAGPTVSGYVAELGRCIQIFGYSNPKAARGHMALALQSFPGYASTLADVPIHPWNTCKSSFAGKGGRYDCQDRLLGTDNKGPVLVVIPAGEGHDSFAIGKYELAEADFNAWCEATGECQSSQTDGAFPATGRSVDEVSRYLAWLSESTGFRYRLPTHEEWLYAADAGGSGVDSGRNCTLTARGIVKGQVMQPVEAGNSNNWGLINHVGNAREMVTLSGGVQAAGGSRKDSMDDCTVGALSQVSSSGDEVTGFRVVRTLE